MERKQNLSSALERNESLEIQDKHKTSDRSLKFAHLPARRKPDQERNGLSYSLVGKCTESYVTSRASTCKILYKDCDGRTKNQNLRCIDGLTINEGDEVLLLKPVGSPEPIIIGKLASIGPHSSIKLDSGHTLLIEKESEGSNTPIIKLKQPDGSLALEIHLAEKKPRIYLPSKDLSLDLEGRLKISARSIDLVSKLGNVNVKANDDFKVNAERIWFN